MQESECLSVSSAGWTERILVVTMVVFQIFSKFAGNWEEGV